MRSGVRLSLAAVLIAMSVCGCKAKLEKKPDPREKWVTRAAAIEKSACACADANCAKNQQAALNAYVKDTKGVKIDNARANKVAKLVLKAQTCISKLIMKEKLKHL